jgi:hypothetical protein
MSNTNKQTPEELVYLKYLDKNPNAIPFVESSVQLLTKVETVGWLFKMVHEGKIKSLSPYLQRILLTKVWKANNYLKSKSYIRDLWKGLGQTTPFFLVPLELVLSNIEEVEQQTDDSDVLAQLKEVKDKIEEFKVDGVELINLDGQTRSKESILPYLTSKYNLSSNEDASVINVFDGNNSYEDISTKTFVELKPIQKGYFLQIPLIINILISGSLDDITNSLISINSNEKWTNWQEIYHGTWISVFPKRIHEVYEIEESGVIKDFFINKIKDAGRYNADVSGWEQWIAEHLFFLKNKYYPTISDLKTAIKKNGPDVPTKAHSKALREYILEVRDNYTSDLMLTHQFISDWCLFRDAIDNGNTKNNPHYAQFSVRKFKVLSTPKLLEWFIRTTETLVTEELPDENGVLQINEKSYTYDGKYIVPKADSFYSHKRGGYKYASIIGRIKTLINELNESFEDLTSEMIISTTTAMPSKSAVRAASGYKSNANVLIDPTKKSADKYERGHDKSVKNGGSNNLSNIKPQIKKANRAQSGRNMVGSKKKK